MLVMGRHVAMDHPHQNFRKAFIRPVWDNVYRIQGQAGIGSRAFALKIPRLCSLWLRPLQLR
jgi:hypothetical protein